MSHGGRKSEVRRQGAATAPLHETGVDLHLAVRAQAKRDRVQGLDEDGPLLYRQLVFVA